MQQFMMLWILSLVIVSVGSVQNGCVMFIYCLLQVIVIIDLLRLVISVWVVGIMKGF